MSKQLKKLSYEPETITLDVSSAITTDSGTLTISQIKVLLENAKNTITYKTSANYSEVLHLAQADYENLTAPKATYTADYYDSSTNVYYKHIIVVSYNTLFNSATWVFVSAPMVSGSSSDLQEKLVSGTNIKTVNNNSLLGSGNLAISEFPERSETDATLAQIAGVNSQGHPDVGKVAAANMDSGSATAGQVLTADGSGGCAWANAGGGGGTQLYKHKIKLNNLYNIILFSKNNTQVTSIYELASMVENDSVISHVTYDYDDIFIIYKFEGIKVNDVYGLEAMVLSSIKYVSGAYKLDYTVLTSISSITDTVTTL